MADAVNCDMSTKFGLLIDFDSLKTVTATNRKPEVLSRRGSHLEKLKAEVVIFQP